MNFTLNRPLIEACCSLNIFLLLPLNCYTVWGMFTGTKRTLDSDIFSLNLTLSEIYFSLNIIWLFIFYHTNTYVYLDLHMFSLGLLFTARPIFQTCICVEYYLGVVHPVLFLKWKPLRYRVVFICVAWLITIASCIYCVFVFYISVYQYAFFLQNLVFMAIVVFCCLSVLKALKNPGPGENTTNKKQNRPKTRAFNMIFLTLICMVVNFIFSVAPIPIQCCIDPNRYIEVFTVCIAFSLISCIMQPLFYLYRAEKLTCFKPT